MPTSRRGRSLGLVRRQVVLREAGGRLDVLEGTAQLDDWTHDGVVVATPVDGWDNFVAVLRDTGFLA